MFLLAQIGDLLYLFFLMLLSETIFKAPKNILYGIISIFFTSKIILLYFYINNKKYSILLLLLLRFILFLLPISYFIGMFLNIKIMILSGIISYILLPFILILDFIDIYRNSAFKIWKTVLVFLYLYITYYLVMIILLMIGEISL